MRCLMCLSVMAILTAAHAETPLQKTITVIGSASEAAKPDRVTIDIGVVTADKVTVRAVSANNALMAKVVEAIMGQGVPESAMQTSRFAIEPQHPREKDGTEDMMVTTGYTVANTLTIVLDDVSKAPLVLDAAVRAGANTSNSVTYDVKNHAALDDRVLTAAMKDARHTAEIMATAEGGKLGKLISATKGQQWGGYGVVANSLASYSPVPPPLMGGEVAVSATVSVVFAFE